MKIFGPKPEEAFKGTCCLCMKQFVTGDMSFLIPLMPDAGDLESVGQYLRGESCTTKAVEVHFDCAGLMSMETFTRIKDL